MSSSVWSARHCEPTMNGITGTTDAPDRNRQPTGKITP
jgi:hypothetical protein